jgi:hypothetical protein
LAQGFLRSNPAEDYKRGSSTFGDVTVFATNRVRSIELSSSANKIIVVNDAGREVGMNQFLDRVSRYIFRNLVKF